MRQIKLREEHKKAGLEYPREMQYDSFTRISTSSLVLHVLLPLISVHRRTICLCQVLQRNWIILGRVEVDGGLWLKSAAHFD